MTNLAVGRLLPPVIELDVLDNRTQPFLALAGDSGFPGANISGDVDIIRRQPHPFISSLTMMQFWTLSAWQKARIDVSAATGIKRPSSIGVFIIVCPDRDTRFRFGVVNSSRLAIDAFAEKQIKEHTFGVGLRPDADDISRAMISWSGELVPKSTTARMDVFFGPDGLGHSWSVLSTPQGSDGFRLRFSMDGSRTVKPIPMLVMSQPISSGQRAFLRLKLDSVEVGVAMEPKEGMAINVGLLSSHSQGLAVNLRFQYRFFTVTLPVWISKDPKDLHTTIMCLVIPATLWGLWNTVPLFTARRRRLYDERRIAAHRSLSLKIENLRHRRQFALEQQQAMKPEADARRRAEHAKSGLIIENAVFYIDDVDPIKASRAKRRGPEFSSELDVTIPLQFWVENSKLTIASAPKRSMLGFYCPFAPAVDKARPKLRVRYSYQGIVYSCIVAECEPLRLPDIRHSRV